MAVFHLDHHENDIRPVSIDTAWNFACGTVSDDAWSVDHITACAGSHAGLKATQLKDLDLAYAPPYSSAKDPVNMAGFMIDNIAKGTLKQWHLEDMDKISRDKSVVLLDVRTVGEFNRGHMDGFKNIPVDELRERINEIEKGKSVYLICQSGLRSYIASRILEGNGYETYNFSGGFRFYDAVVNDRALIEKAYACGMDY